MYTKEQNLHSVQLLTHTKHQNLHGTQNYWYSVNRVVFIDFVADCTHVTLYTDVTELGKSRSVYKDNNKNVIFYLRQWLVVHSLKNRLCD